jgi:hypothetical protein
VIFLLPCVARAGYLKGDHVFTGSLGGVIGANDANQVKGMGPGGGIAYRYYAFDFLSFGADLALDYYGSHYSNDTETDTDTLLLATTLLSRLDFWPGNDWAAYISLGVGSNHLESTFHEADGNRTESTWRAGYFLALGFEVPLKGKWMWGGELRSSDPLGVSANALGLKATLSRRFGKELTPSN